MDTTRVPPVIPTLVFDDSCPMCQIYTGAFSKLGWAQRQAFGECDARVLGELDLDRARHEIPMFDPESGRVLYGLDSLFTVIGTRIPMLRPVLRLPVTAHVIRPVYKLISYNRRHIAGCPPPAGGFDCAPDFHPGWSATYLALGAGSVAALAASPPVVLAGGATAAVAVAVLGPAVVEPDTARRVEVASQSTTSVLVAAGVARLATALRLPRPVAVAAGAAAGFHQVARRRFLRLRG